MERIIKERTDSLRKQGRLIILTRYFLFVGFVLLVSGCGPIYDPDLPAPTIHAVNYGKGGSATLFVPSLVKPIPDPQQGPAGWVPSPRVEDKQRWRGILIHHSYDPASGTAADIDAIHRARGFDGLGYHFVINNGRGGRDGRVEVGYRWKKQETGAHCRVSPNDNNYWNEHTIGICLIGNFERSRPSEAQYRSLSKLVQFLMVRYHIKTRDLLGHGDVKATKCPGRNFSFWELKRRL